MLQVDMKLLLVDRCCGGENVVVELLVALLRLVAVEEVLEVENVLIDVVQEDRVQVDVVQVVYGLLLGARVIPAAQPLWLALTRVLLALTHVLRKVALLVRVVAGRRVRARAPRSLLVLGALLFALTRVLRIAALCAVAAGSWAAAMVISTRVLTRAPWSALAAVGRGASGEKDMSLVRTNDMLGDFHSCACSSQRAGW